MRTENGNRKVETPTSVSFRFVTLRTLGERSIDRPFCRFTDIRRWIACHSLHNRACISERVAVGEMWIYRRSLITALTFILVCLCIGASASIQTVCSAPVAPCRKLEIFPVRFICWHADRQPDIFRIAAFFMWKRFERMILALVLECLLRYKKL